MNTKSENGMGLSTRSTDGGPAKRAYRAPSLTVYGDLRKLTLLSAKQGIGTDGSSQITKVTGK